MVIPKKLSPHDFSRIDSVTDPHVSLDGRLGSFIKRSNGKTYVVWFDISNTQMTEVEIPVKFTYAFGGGVSQISKDGMHLFFVTKSGGIAVIDRRSGAISEIYDGPGVSQISLGSNDELIAGVIFGDRAALFSTERKSAPKILSEFPRIYAPFGGLPEHVSYFANERPDFILDINLSDDGTFVSWHEWALPKMPWQRSQIALMNLAELSNPSPSISICAGGDYFVSQPRFSPDGRTLGFLAEVGSYLHLWTADLSTWRAREISTEEREHGGVPWGSGSRTFAFSQNGESVYYSRNEGGFGRLVCAELSSGELSDVAKAHHFGMQCSNNTLIALRSGSKTPHVLVSYQLDDFSRTEIERVFASGFYEAPSAEPLLAIAPYSSSLYKFVKDDWIDEFASVAPLDIPYRLYRPTSEADKKFPTIVSFHGGPTDQSLVTYSTRNTAFIQAGYQVLTFDYRGSSGWGREFREGLDREFGVAEIVDLLTVLSDLVSKGLVSLGDVVLNGGSSGGYSALRSICVTQGLFSGVIAEYPLIDLADSASSTHRFESRYFDDLVGKLPSEIDRYGRRSIDPAEMDDVPVLIMHGSSDPVVNHQQVVRFVERAHKLGKAVEFTLFEGEGHGFSFPASIESEFRSYEKFLSRVAHKKGHHRSL